jgi:UDP-glucose 4-epimerase
VLDHAPEQLAVYNLGPSDWTSVRRIAELCVAASPHKSARIEYSGGTQGWPGDVPTSRLKPERLSALGFRVRYTSDQAVAMAVREVAREVFGASLDA